MENGLINLNYKDMQAFFEKCSTLNQSVNSTIAVNTPNKDKPELQNTNNIKHSASSNDVFENNLLTLTNKMNLPSERRSSNTPVAVDKRSGQDRRERDRILGSKLSYDLYKVKNTVTTIQPVKDDTVLESFGYMFPTTRRILCVNDDKNNHYKAIGLIMIGLLNLKEDIRDLLAIIGLTKSQAPKGYHARFKYFAGTLAENKLKKFEWGQEFLDRYDNTLADTELGNKTHEFFKIEPDIKFFKKEIKYPFLKNEIVNRQYVKLRGPFIGKLSCLTLHRIPKISLVIGFILEIPEIIRNIREKKNFKQIPKSVFNVASYTVLGGLSSAFVSIVTKSPAGSIIGFGIGIFMAKQLTKFIFKSKSNN